MNKREVPQSMLDMLKYTEEEVKNLTRKQRELLCVGEDIYNYKMYAEVVKTAHCRYLPKINDRYVFAPKNTLIPEECT